MPSYADSSSCLRCGVMGGPHHQISSSAALEARALALSDALRPLCEQKGRMLGLLQADGEVIVTLSSIAAVSYAFVRAVQTFDAHMVAIAHDWSTVPKRSLGGHALGAYFDAPADVVPAKAYFKVTEPQPKAGPHNPKRSTLPLAGGPGCVCAAPKLLSYLTQDKGADQLPPKSVTMIELWCGKSEGQWVHRKLAPSCGNCSRILPTLACRAPATVP